MLDMRNEDHGYSGWDPGTEPKLWCSVSLWDENLLKKKKKLPNIWEGVDRWLQPSQKETPGGYRCF